MKRSSPLLVTASLALFLSSTGAFAQGRDRRPPRQPGSDRRQTVAPTPRPIPPASRDSRETRVPRTNGVDLERYPQVKQRVTAMLPQGMSLADASSGFKTQGQFIAALHASRNLGIPFAALKAKMTGPDAKPLGAAIHDLKSNLDLPSARQQAQKAQQQAVFTQQ